MAYTRTMSSKFLGFVVISGLLMVHCEPSKPAAAPVSAPPLATDKPSANSAPDDRAPNPATASSEGDEASEDAVAAETTEQDTSPEVDADAEDPALAKVREACKALCSRFDESCSERQAAGCRLLCQDYLDKASGCETQSVAAIECQAQSERSLLCINVTPTKCAAPFKTLKLCRQGTSETTPASSTALPEGWERITDSQLGFAVNMPKGALLDPLAEPRRWHVASGDAEYLVVELPAPREPVTSRVLLRLATGFVGYRCQKGLKLHGQFEIDDEVAMLIDTRCPDGTKWHGMMRVQPDRALITVIRSAAGSPADADKFFYSYERLETPDN